MRESTHSSTQSMGEVGPGLRRDGEWEGEGGAEEGGEWEGEGGGGGGGGRDQERIKEGRTKYSHIYGRQVVQWDTPKTAN